MGTKQFQLLMQEGKLVTVVYNLGTVSPTKIWTVYEGVVDGEDSFILQHHSRGYPTRMVNSMRCIRRNTHFDAKTNAVSLRTFRVERYDIDNPKNPILSKVLEARGIWEEPFR